MPHPIPVLEEIHDGSRVHRRFHPRRIRHGAPVLRHLSTLAALILGVAPLARAAEPTIDQMIALKRAGSPQPSPDGRLVAYTVRDTDWVNNGFVTQLWLADVEA